MRDPNDAKLMQQFLSVQEGEHFIGASVIQFRPTVGIDMIHHQRNLPLRIIAKIGPLRDDPPDKLMIILAVTFLAWS